MNLNQFVEDTDVIVEYLTERFHTDKVLIVGTSWGTIVGTKYSMQHPQKGGCLYWYFTVCKF